RCHNRARSALISCARPPGLPYSCDAHDGGVLTMNLERSLPLPVGLPFEEAAQRHDAPLTHNQMAEQAALEYCFTLGIDCRKRRCECALEIRNKLPSHFLELTLTVNESKYDSVLGWAQVVNRGEIDQI